MKSDVQSLTVIMYLLGDSLNCFRNRQIIMRNFYYLDIGCLIFEINFSKDSRKQTIFTIDRKWCFKYNHIYNIFTFMLIFNEKFQKTHI